MLSINCFVLLVQLGSAIVKTNPIDMIGKVPAISVPSENFKPAIPGSSSHSCNLHLEITTFPETTMNNRGMSISADYR